MPDEIGHVGHPDDNVTELAERMDRVSVPRADGGQRRYTSPTSGINRNTPQLEVQVLIKA